MNWHQLFENKLIQVEYFKYIISASVFFVLFPYTFFLLALSLNEKLQNYECTDLINRFEGIRKENPAYE